MYTKKEIAKLKQRGESWEKYFLRSEPEKEEDANRVFITESGIPIKNLYTPLDLEEKNWDYLERLGFPGEHPYTRGPNPTMYRGNMWVMNPYGGYGTAEATNKRFKYLLDQGATMLGIAQDLPTQLGLDSDNPLSRGEVGKVGVAIDSLKDIEIIFDDISIDKVSIGTTSNATGPIFLAFMLALAEKRGIPPEKLRLYIQNDILKEFISRHTYIFPPKPSLKFSCDVAEYCYRNGLTNIQCYTNCGYHMREAGASPVQEIAFALANLVEVLKEYVRRGINLNEFYRPSASFVAGMNFFEEICKHRAYRRMFARIMKYRFKVTNPRAMSVAIYDNSQASAFTAQQPLNNIVRGTITCLVQALSGIQAMTIASYDEAHSIPSEEAAKLSLRTQQITAYETDVTYTADPLGGSYYIETLTDELEEKANKLFEEVEGLGGALAGIEEGFQEREIAEEAYRTYRRIKNGEKIVVGVNKFNEDDKVAISIMKVDPKEEKKQIQRLQLLKKERDNGKVNNSLKQLRRSAKQNVNLVSPIFNAIKLYATVGEICDTLRSVYGEHGMVAF